MKVLKRILLLMVLVGLVLVAAYPAQYEEAEYVPGEVIVGMEPGAFAQAWSILSPQLQAYGGEIVDSIPVLSAMLIMVPVGSELDFINTVSMLAEVAFAEPNYIYELDWTPNDPKYTEQWGLKKIDAAEAWDITKGSREIIVAVIDTGVDYMHWDLVANYAYGVDYIDNDNDPYPSDFTDKNGAFHGSHVAGIAVATTNNAIGIAGIAQSTLIGIRGCKGDGKCNTWATTQGIVYAAERGAHIINMSFGGGQMSKTMQAACQYAYNNGVLLIAAAGNEKSSKKHYPAAYDEVIAVSATDENDKLANFSNYGSWVELAAPGVKILSLFPKQRLVKASGTSMASPHVAGVAALVWSANPELTNKQVREILRKTADDLGSPGKDDKFGYGRVNAYKAVKEAQGEGPPPPTPTGELTVEVDRGCAPVGMGYQVGEQVMVSYTVPEDATVTLYRVGYPGTVETIFTGHAAGGIQQSAPGVTATSPGVETIIIQARTYSGQVLTAACTYSIGGVNVSKSRIWIDKGCGATYRIDEPITVSASVDEPSSIKIFDFATDGSISPILEQHANAGETIILRGRVVGPAGRDTLVVRAETDSGLVVTNACSLNITD